MSIYGALYSSVSGIRAQGTAIGIISDNISNVNTVGYKAGSQYFGTLVTNSGSATSYAPGGVRAQNRQLISQQGLVQTTSSPLDIALQGNGMFVVSTGPDGTADDSILFTRAGSFSTDSVGNFKNAAGYFLQAWPLDNDGEIPANSSSPTTLQTVNIGNAFGEAAATTRVTVKANLDASKDILAGAGQTGVPGTDGINDENLDITGSSILVPNANLGLNFAGPDFNGDILRVTTTPDSTTAQDDFVYGGFTQGDDITATILGASTQTQKFSTGTLVNDKFTITLSSDVSNPRTFTLVTSNPKAGEFTSLETLAKAIDGADGLTARVATLADGTVRLFVSAEDARDGITFAQSAGSTANFPTALGLVNIPASPSINRWNTLVGFAKLANEESSGRLKAEVIDSPGAAQIKILNADPLSEITFSNVNDDANAAALGNFLAEFQFSSATSEAAYNGVAGSDENSMASGKVEPTFEKTFDVYDTLGAPHQITIGFVKVGDNKWLAEVYAAKAADIQSTISGDTTDRFIAATEVEFDGRGNLLSLSPNWLIPSSSPSVRWTGGADPSVIAFDLGAAGGKTGLSQSSGLDSSTITQNGAAVGLLDTVSIDSDGFVIANFNNGQSKKLYKIPIATFSNYNGLEGRNGNVFIQTLDSGDANLAESGKAGAGRINPEALETSNTELSEELTDMIVAQRAYQASAKVITTADELLDELNRIT